MKPGEGDVQLNYRQADQAELEFYRCRLGGLAHRVEWLQSDHLLAVFDPDCSHMMHNRILISQPPECGELESMLGRFEAAALEPRLEVSPDAQDAGLGELLARGGWRSCGETVIHFGRTPETPSFVAAPGVTVERVGAAQLPGFLRVFLRAYPPPDGYRLRTCRRVQSWLEMNSMSLWLARLDGQPAGAAMLTCLAPVAHFAYAATLPQHRNRGVQAALVAARVECARQQGLECMTGAAEAGSSSSGNLLRGGLSECYRRVHFCRDAGSGTG